ncbi:MAG: DUF4982 domain-containing protein [Clostridium sp.]|nr:DUF4982 domain-containing protein [Clostridium sp.]
MKTLIYRLTGLACMFMLWPTLCGAQEADRKTLFNNDWKFHLGDEAQASQPDYDDRMWRTLDLPHDWSIEGSVNRENPAGNDGGYFPTGIGWYRKTFRIDNNQTDRLTSVYFEGVYMNAEVFINGKSLGIYPYGYSTFSHDLTPYLHEGDNVMAVKVDNSAQKNCRWYTGSGIYRNVWLITTEAVHFTQWGTVITTQSTKENNALVTVSTTIANESKRDITVNLSTLLGSKNNTSTTTDKTAVKLKAGETRNINRQITLVKPNLWSPENPALYEARLALCTDDGQHLDNITETFGIRDIRYSATEGLTLNGHPILLNGGCLHHDNGCLGAAAYKDAEWRKALLMKEAGFNAVRTSHNPPSEEFLNACDQLGLLVIDEAFDGWNESKTPHDYSTLLDQWWTRDLEAMVLRDRNHPSIFCWSIGNEIIERKSPLAVLTANAFAGHVRRIDPTRPVTSALTTWDNTWEIYDPLAAAHDIVGYNYQLHRAESDHQRIPSRIIMQTESYPREAFANWTRVNDHPYVIGDFVWTAVDYLGESGIGRYFYKGETEGEHYNRDQYPWHGAYCGDIDLTGWRKPISHYRDMLYNADKKLYMAVKEPDGYHGTIKETLWSVWPTWENWNWPGHEGKDIQVEIYSRYDTVRLYLNDRLVGELPTGREQEFKALFTLPYEPGLLRAVGVENNKETESTSLETAGKPARIELTSDRTSMPTDGSSLAFVTAIVTDKQGRTVPNADNMLTFGIQGEGQLLATCNANLKDTVSYTSTTRQAWNGRTMAVVKAGKKKGKLKLTVKGKGLTQATLTIDIK